MLQGQLLLQALHSRRFWLAVVSALLVIANQGLGLNLDSTTVLAFAGIVITAILGDSLAHVAHATPPTVVVPPAATAPAAAASGSASSATSPASPGTGG